METITMHYCVTRSSLRIKLTYTITGFVNVWHFSREMFVHRVVFMAMCFWPFTWKILMETVFYLKPQYYARYHTILFYITILYCILFLFFVLFCFIPYAHTICRGECLLILGYGRG
jgi:hypothetical protein